jgi:hypothetical protein
MLSSIDRSPRAAARIAGLSYLAIILLGIFGEGFVRGALVVPGDAAATARAIAGAQPLWRAGIVGDLLMHVLDVPVLVIFYVLLRPVSQSLALLATLINLVQTAVLATNKLILVVPLLLLGPSASLTAFTSGQLQALSMLALQLHSYGLGVGLIFFGFACLVHGWLIVKCGYIPPVLGLGLVVAGLSYLVNSLALLLAPPLAAALFPWILLPALVGESALCLWLIVKGVELDQWNRRAAPRARPR